MMPYILVRWRCRLLLVCFTRTAGVLLCIGDVLRCDFVRDYMRENM